MSTFSGYSYCEEDEPQTSLLKKLTVPTVLYSNKIAESGVERKDVVEKAS